MSTVKGEIKKGRDFAAERQKRRQRRKRAPSSAGVKVIPVSPDYRANYDQIRWDR